MTVSISEVTALLSLFVAFVAYRNSVVSSRDNSKKIDKIANDYMVLTSNIAISEASKKYISLLSEVNKEFECIVAKLAHPALSGSVNIGDVFDEFDAQRHSHPYLRHALNTSVRVVREAYDYELTYQTGLNLVSRLRALKFIKGDVVLYESEKSKASVFAFLKKKSVPQGPEEIIAESSVFWESLGSVYNRIPEEKESELFRKVLPCIQEYIALHSEYRPRLKVLEEKLEDAIKENSLEMFNIRDVSGLGEKFYRVKGDIGRMRELYLPDFYRIEEVPVSEGVSYSLYAASVLFIASQHFMWGSV
ncbi:MULTISPECIES: hypothetical protein [unclassified Pseudomonas]|uniref:hypothetical protein n=1 Tax=unclassified Pseudomonas TaxID=196821 RepID=UPI0011A32FB8|nr:MULTISPECIES: hypothetical protein [unclassified Pseudomonas]TWC21576.1 hypothetical protein FBY05_108141 [Pseudomonas sp. SJZ083]TWC48008.1 hypothetical protein FBY01_108108 [Pseudomonas sp. SJZ077]